MAGGSADNLEPAVSQVKAVGQNVAIAPILIFVPCSSKVAVAKDIVDINRVAHFEYLSQLSECMANSVTGDTETGACVRACSVVQAADYLFALFSRWFANTVEERRSLANPEEACSRGFSAARGQALVSSVTDSLFGGGDVWRRRAGRFLGTIAPRRKLKKRSWPQVLHEKKR